MVEPETLGLRPSAAQRLGAPETLGISTLDPGHRPPAMPPGRQVAVRVHMLDDTEEIFDVSLRASGKVLFDLVCSHLNLIEGDYFGLEFHDHRKMNVWLDLLKPIVKQLRRPKHTVLRFVVKFFPPDHAQLLEELTRYLFALQVKQDLACGRLTCNDSSAALLVSNIIQSEIGDFEESQCRSHLLNNNYIPDQMALIDKIMEFHSKNVGQTPAESDFQLLEVARRLEMYGVRLHPAKDREGTKLSLAVAHTGVLVFQGHTKINAFNWSKVRKLSFKRKRYLIKLRPDLNKSSYQDTLEFLMASRDCCKVFWKICVEYHAFFRLFEEPKPKPKPVIFTRGSSFRFSGRTQKQVIDYVKESEFKKIPFERKHSRVQHNSRLSPLPSPHRPDVPKETVSSAPAERQTTPPRRHWKESALVSAEDPLALRTHPSPASQRNGRDDQPMPKEEDPPGPTRQSDHLNPGPSRGLGANISSIPHIDCNDVDNQYQYDVGRVRGSRGQGSEGVREVVMQAAGGVNGAWHPQQEVFTGRMRSREVTPAPKPPLGLSRDLNEPSSPRYYAHHGPLHSPALDEEGRGASSPLTLRHATKSPAPCPSPGAGASHRMPSLGHAEQNGHCSAPPRWDDRGFNAWGAGPRDEGLSHAAGSSPMVSRKLHGALVPNLTGSAPAPEPRAVLSRSERMAALERRMMANGLSAPGQPRLSPAQGRYGGRGSAHLVGAVQMIDGSTSSGSESSDSEVDVTGGYAHAVSPAPPAASPALPRNTFSFGSLQLDEEMGEEGGVAYSDEDGTQVFSC